MVASGVATGPRAASAQQTFTQQIILVPPFEGRDARLGGAVADGVRGRLQRHYKRREVSVIGEYAMEQVLERSNIEVASIDSILVRQLARQMRADELVMGSAERVNGRVRVLARLTLTRDRHFVQWLAAIDAPTADSAGALVATGLELVRRQLIPHRRCENALREGQVEQAIAEARRVAATLPDPALLRACLVSALILSAADAREVLPEAQRILATQPRSYIALDAAARSYDALEEKGNAARMWLRLQESDSLDIPLARRVVTALFRGGNAAHARPLVVKLSDQMPEDLDLLRSRWDVLLAVSDFPAATTVGERLMREDTVSRGDSTFAFRLASAHRAKGDTVKAVAVAADGVTRFPRDARLYLLYADLVQVDSRVTLDRGLTRFPDLAELHLLRAQELRRAGKSAEAIAPLRRAMALDPLLAQGYLALAQTQVDLGMLDSALATTRQAVPAGEPPATVAAFALARGNAIYRAANSTKQRTDYQLALQFLSLADSLQSTPQSRFLLGATALSIGQSAATDAPATRACDLSRLANEMLPLAREKITAGAQVAPDASRQYLAYLDQLEPVVAQQVATLCTG